MSKLSAASCGFFVGVFGRSNPRQFARTDFHAIINEPSVERAFNDPFLPPNLPPQADLIFELQQLLNGRPQNPNCTEATD